MATPLQGGYEYQHYCYFYPDIINLQRVRADLEGPPAACRVVTERQSVLQVCLHSHTAELGLATPFWVFIKTGTSWPIWGVCSCSEGPWRPLIC